MIWMGRSRTVILCVYVILLSATFGMLLRVHVDFLSTC